MLDFVIEQTNIYIDTMQKEDRKKYGQFFTSKETALFMASLYNIPSDIEHVSILDAGAGSGILVCALVERLQNYINIDVIKITCYETDSNILDILNSNLEYIKENSNIKMEYRIIKENYITSQYYDFNNTIVGAANPIKYDFVIGNPPYMKISKDAPEAIAMPIICYGAPNLYFIFASMSLFNLKENGEMVYIIPRSWTSGAYFKRFRQYFLSESKLEHIHLFISRDKVFDKESVLQETIIIKVKKTKQVPDTVMITSSKSNKDFNNITTLKVPYNVVISGDNFYVYLVTNNDEITVLDKINRWNSTLPSIGLKMKTGLTVDFRTLDNLRDKKEINSIPMFYEQHIKNGMVHFPINREHEYIVTNKTGLMQDNKNYLFVKRFTSKEEKRRLQCGIYLSNNLMEYSKISTQNKINFIDKLSGELSEKEVYGLYVIFNSTLYDLYYRILNGSTQVNSTEINFMPVPPLEIIREMGTKLLLTSDLSEENCNRIMEEYYD